MRWTLGGSLRLRRHERQLDADAVYKSRWLRVIASAVVAIPLALILAFIVAGSILRLGLVGGIVYSVIFLVLFVVVFIESGLWKG